MCAMCTINCTSQLLSCGLWTTGHASLGTPALPPIAVLSDGRAMVWDHMKWALGPPQCGIGLGGVSVLLTDFYTVCRGCGVLW